MHMQKNLKVPSCRWFSQSQTQRRLDARLLRCYKRHGIDTRMLLMYSSCSQLAKVDRSSPVP